MKSTSVARPPTPSEVADALTPVPVKENIVTAFLSRAFSFNRVHALSLNRVGRAKVATCRGLYLRMRMRSTRPPEARTGQFAPIEFVAPIFNGSFVRQVVSRTDHSGKGLSLASLVGEDGLLCARLATGDPGDAVAGQCTRLPNWSVPVESGSMRVSAQIAACPHCAGEALAYAGSEDERRAAFRAHLCPVVARTGGDSCDYSQLVGVGQEESVIKKLAKGFDWASLTVTRPRTHVFETDPLLSFGGLGVIVDATELGNGRMVTKSVYIKEIDIRSMHAVAREYFTRSILSEVGESMQFLSERMREGVLSAKALIESSTRPPSDYEKALKEARTFMCFTGDLLMRGRAISDDDAMKAAEFNKRTAENTSRAIATVREIVSAETRAISELVRIMRVGGDEEEDEGARPPRENGCASVTSSALAGGRSSLFSRRTEGSAERTFVHTSQKRDDAVHGKRSSLQEATAAAEARIHKRARREAHE
jgi:hypothetical protein